MDVHLQADSFKVVFALLESDGFIQPVTPRSWADHIANSRALKAGRGMVRFQETFEILCNAAHSCVSLTTRP